MRFFVQSLFKIHMKPECLPESFSIGRLRVRNEDGNHLAFYRSDYLRFEKYARSFGIDMTSLDRDALLHHVHEFNAMQSFVKEHLRLVVYFSSENLAQLQLDPRHADFSISGVPRTCSGMSLRLHGEQNCILMHEDGRIYMHPKVRANMVKNIFGVHHSSLLLAHHSPVKFSGSLYHEAERGWILDNASGHFGTRPTQMRRFVQKLRDCGVDISSLTLRFFIKIDFSLKEDDNSNYTTFYENAAEFLERTSAVISRMAASEASACQPS